MKLITIKEVSKILSVKVSTLYSWAHTGIIPAYKLNGALRFKSEEIEAWVLASKIAPTVITLRTNNTLRNGVDDIIKRTIEDEKRTRYNNTQTGNRLESSPKKGGRNGAL